MPSVNRKDHLLDGPIPGESLTAPAKSNTWETPPAFVDPVEFSDHVWETIKKPKISSNIKKMLELGMSAEGIAKGILFESFSNGAITPDLALLVQKPVTYMIGGIGKAQGLSEFNMTDPDTKTATIQAELDLQLEKKMREKAENNTPTREEDLRELRKDIETRSIEGVIPSYPDDTDPEFNGFFGDNGGL